MNSLLVIEHVALSELPAAWRQRLSIAQEKRVRVVIEEEKDVGDTGEAAKGAVAFGMWRDREDMADVDGYVRQLRSPRSERA